MVVASAAPGEAATLLRGVTPGARGRARAVELDAGGNADALEAAVREADAVLSLLPARMHAAVAAAGVRWGRGVVTASYACEGVRALAGRAEAAGVPVLCEMGLDPGIDHMSAMRLIDAARAAGGRVRAFRSLCGGLPAPACAAAAGPLRYKFSWSPRGVLSASAAAAIFHEDGARPARAPRCTGQGAAPDGCGAAGRAGGAGGGRGAARVGRPRGR